MSVGLLKEGQIFGHRFRVVRCLASGGMGAVYEARHSETERRVALKVMLPHIVASEDMRQRFKQEARVTASINSEFIVDVLDAGVDDDSELPFIAMEFLIGEDLGDLVHRMGAIPATDVVTYLHQVSLALAKTHAQLIVHRDLKPENLFLTRRDDGGPRIKILDFGISKVIVESATSRNQTLNLGTPTYMAPEQFMGSVSPATDIYALGMIAYALLVGVPFWHEEAQSDGNVFAFASQVMNGPTEQATVRAERKGVRLPIEFDAWFAKATAKEPNDRFASAVEAVCALSDVFGMDLPRAAAASISIRPPAPAGAPTAAGPRGGKPTAARASSPEIGGVAQATRLERVSTAMASSKDASDKTAPKRRSSVGALIGAGSVVVVGAIGMVIASRAGLFGARHSSAQLPVETVVASQTSLTPSAAPSAPVVVVESPPAASGSSGALAAVSASASTAQPGSGARTGNPATKAGAKGAEAKKSGDPAASKTGSEPVAAPPAAQPAATSTTPYSRY
jgi:eukaryotic-like serine/threonine-protein kinase